MAYELENIAKEITLAVLPKTASSGNGEPEEVGKRYGLLFKTILKEVTEAHIESNKIGEAKITTSTSERH